MSAQTTTVLLTGERHRIARRALDARIVETGCGLTVAREGGPFDPDSAYQRANFPKAEHPTPCPRCFS